MLVISGSERVYVNGILLERGENNDYIIDYNAGEVIFNSIFPINSEMRINIEYQYTDRNFTRFVTYGGVVHEQEKFKIGGFIYSENDIKNQPLQQNLSAEQIDVLQNAGDDNTLMTAPSAYLDSYSDNKILYKKEFIGGIEAFVFSNDETDELYNVRFTFVGNNLGNYILSNNNTVGKIYEYVTPIAGVPQGNFEPTIPLIAPTKIQIATVLGNYTPSEKTNIDFEIAVSNNDKNLYSNIDDNDNKGVAGKINAKQRLFTGKLNVDAFTNIQLIQKDFRSIERIFNIEFNRDWNLSNPLGNQSLISSGLNFNLKKSGFARYQFEKLNFSKNFSGNKHQLSAILKHKKSVLSTESSILKSDGSFAESSFFRTQNQLKFHLKKNWVGGSFRHENNKEILMNTNDLSNLSQRFSEFGGFIGRGDSTKVFIELGYLNRVNDSLKNGILKKVNWSNSYYLKSQLIKNEQSNLSLFINYRNLQFEDVNRENEPSLNSRILYNTHFFKQLIQFTTVYETTSGTIAQQEFTYLEVEPGQGIYAWNDYNNNGIQELQEFEIAPFPDQAKYVRVFLPNQVFVKTNKNKFSQSILFNGLVWQNETGFKKFISHFYNQSSFLVERRNIRDSNEFNLNPFEKSGNNILGQNNSFRNNLYFNRGKQKHSTTYSYLTNSIKNLLSIGSQENNLRSHQLQYMHLLKKSWLLQVNSSIGTSESISDNYAARNFYINSYELSPKISYLFSKNASLDVFYEFKNQENSINLKEKSSQNKFGTSFTFNSEKGFSINGEYSYYNNIFSGNATSPVGFQMLQGLQNGKNGVWRLLLQKSITQYLDININYQGRKSETSNTIHIGSIQLRAYF